MSDPISQILPDQTERQLLPGEDLTGRDRMAWNVAASWAGHMVFVITGFIMPRFLDQHLGQEALGVWDFGWSLVSYFGLAQVGIGSSVDRYVARYRSVGNARALNCAVSSVMCVQIVSGMIAALLTLMAAWALPVLFPQRLGDQLGSAQWVVLLLGAGLSLQMFLNFFVGVIVGCHRWDLHNGIGAGFHAATAAGMIGVLFLGGGLRSLACVSAAGMAATEITRAFVAYRICPELQLRLRYATWSQAMEMLAFGMKTLVNTLSRLLMYQTNSMIIVSYLGPGALALYSRPRSLVGHAQMFVNKFAFILTPTASSLQADGRREELRELVVQAGRFASFMALPIVLVLVILGDPILRVWMGPRYEQGAVLAILALGHFTEMTRQPIVNILTGMNMHGRLAVVNFAVGVGSVGLGVFALAVLHLGLPGAALSLALPLILVNGIYVPIYVCRRVTMPVWTYLARTSRGPLLCALPFGACLLTGRLLWADHPLLALLYGGGAGAVLLAVLYWSYAVPARVRTAVLQRIRRLRAGVAVRET